MDGKPKGRVSRRSRINSLGDDVGIQCWPIISVSACQCFGFLALHALVSKNFDATPLPALKCRFFILSGM